MSAVPRGSAGEQDRNDDQQRLVSSPDYTETALASSQPSTGAATPHPAITPTPRTQRPSFGSSLADREYSSAIPQCDLGHRETGKGAIWEFRVSVWGQGVTLRFLGLSGALSLSSLCPNSTL